MIYVVEIQGPHGAKATKEYDARSPRELMTMVQRDLRAYPQVWFMGAWEKGRPGRSIFFDIQRREEIYQ